MHTKLNNSDKLETALKPLFLFGKIIGLIPTNFRWSKIILPLLSVNIAVELVNVALSSSSRKSPVDLAAAAGTPMFYALGFFVFRHMHKRQLDIMKLLREWKEIESEYSKKDVKLFRDANFWTGLIFISAISENLVFHFKQCPLGVNGGFLRCLYGTLHPAWETLIPYYSLVSVYLIISNKLALYAWNFMDVLIIILCRATYFRFNTLAQYSGSYNAWSTLRDECRKLLKLLENLENFLSPMVFVSFGMNTYALCMQLNLWLTPSKNKTTLDSIYSVWSSLHLLTRVLAVSLTAAWVNDAAKKIQILTSSCPIQQYCLDLVRLEEMVARNNIGLSGLGCFVVTKRFILSIVSVVFTMEVFLLQSVTETCPKIN